MSGRGEAMEVLSIQTGPVAPLGPDGVPSGIVKTVREGPVNVARLGIDGDGIADLAVHGGPDKAVYGYPARHYEAWRADWPEHDVLWGPGGVGENLTVDGLVEEEVLIGDVFETGGGLTLQVTQPRQPCFKFAARFDNPRLPKAMVRTGRCGFYFRVLSEGSLAAGARLERTRAGHPDWSIARFFRMTTTDLKALTAEDLRALADMEALAEVWRIWARDQHG
ncbi:MAG: MOSC domain-containing protein [Alphaproteobacteria bacterium]